jgi:hypothetical protein
MKENNSSFTTVGDSVLSYVGSGKPSKPSKHTIQIARGTEGRGSSPTGKSAVRGSRLIQEANGPKCHIVAKLYESNAAAAANEQQRQVKIMPSVAGISDFWKARSATGQRY